MPSPPLQRSALLVTISLISALVVAASTQGWRQGVLALIGALFGVSLYQASFGFASAYRHFIVRGDSRGILAQLLMLAVSTALFAPILISGAARGAVAPLALQAVFGAALFGVGMQLGSGCACGTLYAIGGGSSLMLITLGGFGAGSFFASLTADALKGLPRLQPVSLVERWGWQGVLFQLAVLGGLAIFMWAWKLPQQDVSQPFWPRFDWKALFRGPWSTVTGALALALLASLTLALAGRPWGVTWGFTLWTAKLAHGLGWDPATSAIWQQERFGDALQAGLLEDTTSVMNAGIVLGAAAAAAAAGRLSFRRPSSGRLCAAALLGGLTMGYGAWLSYGCNVGAYFGGIASTSLHGWLWIVFALLGTLIGVRLRPLFGMKN